MQWSREVPPAVQDGGEDAGATREEVGAALGDGPVLGRPMAPESNTGRINRGRSEEEDIRDL
jgi:hypothetical protein